METRSMYIWFSISVGFPPNNLYIKKKAGYSYPKGMELHNETGPPAFKIDIVLKLTITP